MQLQNLSAALAKLLRQGCKERILALQAEHLTSIMPTVFQTALHPDKGKGQGTPNLKALTADALLFFVVGKHCGCILINSSAELSQFNRYRHHRPHTEDGHLVFY